MVHWHGAVAIGTIILYVPKNRYTPTFFFLRFTRTLLYAAGVTFLCWARELKNQHLLTPVVVSTWHYHITVGAVFRRCESRSTVQL